MLRSHVKGSAAVVRNMVWVVGGDSEETDQFVDGQWVDGPDIPWVGSSSELLTVSWNKVGDRSTPTSLTERDIFVILGSTLWWWESSLRRENLALQLQHTNLDQVARFIRQKTWNGGYCLPGNRPQDEGSCELWHARIC